MREYAYYWIVFLAVFFLSCLLFTWLIPRLRAMKVGQTILDIGPAWHAPKEGTPTMGGLVFLIVTLLSGGVLFPVLIRNQTYEDVYPFVITWIYCILSGAVGIIDDTTKLRHHKNEGLSPAQKLLLQTLLGGGYIAVMRFAGSIETHFYIPFIGDVELGIAAYVLYMLLLIGMTNCTNLTDGIDGLATATGTVIFATYFLIAMRANYVTPALFSCVLLGCTSSFLFFNYHPARIFMGDTGSLFIGAAVGSLPFMLNSPLLGIICGFLYIFEGATVVMQVLHYKRTHRRLFLMAPFHHHLEKRGWSENKIVAFFVFLTASICILTLFIV